MKSGKLRARMLQLLVRKVRKLAFQLTLAFISKKEKKICNYYKANVVKNNPVMVFFFQVIN